MIQLSEQRPRQVNLKIVYYGPKDFEFDKVVTAIEFTRNELMVLYGIQTSYEVVDVVSPHYTFFNDIHGLENTSFSYSRYPRVIVNNNNVIYIDTTLALDELVKKLVTEITRRVFKGKLNEATEGGSNEQLFALNSYFLIITNVNDSSEEVNGFNEMSMVGETDMMMNESAGDLFSKRI
ncbi:hypothetical protein EYM_07445 [Ignicoccus islandicus DSM 13165]|uniref:Uncharacterized protein n=1 Tax=Ignicoccus islandicus DSM 13165 TaxID=940295 RepID=A0A0U3G3M7_9CREN|nr:hypothetical protein [Ignicoccus islandicus]ALU12780.1 hypothetical protein EYM_07445 [Ignicoccus islandicus DSM 13165]